MMRTLAFSLAVVGLFCGGAMANAQEGKKKREREEIAPHGAVCVLRPTQGSKVRGVVIFRQRDGFVQVFGQVRNLTPGKHGFHIHEFGDVRGTDGTAAGGHYNPKGQPHGGLDSAKRHAGDLGNIEADAEGVAKFRIRAHGLNLHHVIGRSVVVHGGEDDLTSQPSGDAGPRVAIGVIGLAGPQRERQN